MTANQINYAKMKVDRAHYKRMDKETRRHNKELEQVEQFKAQSTDSHYQRSDAINLAHYERADSAALTQASASAKQAKTASERLAFEKFLELPNEGTTVDYRIINYAGDNEFYGALENQPLSVVERMQQLRQGAQNYRNTISTNVKIGAETENIKAETKKYGSEIFANIGKGSSGAANALKAVLPFVGIKAD